MNLEQTNEKLRKEFNELRDFVIQKNVDYNNSLQNPVSVFQTSKMQGILGRLDDKLNRIKHAGVNEMTLDTMDDIIGYLIHLKIMININKEESKEFTKEENF
jgi:hypothetical protein